MAKTPDRRSRRSMLALLLVLAAGAAHSQVADAPSPLPLPLPDPRIAAALATISPSQVQADISRLVSFGTRNTLSSMSVDLPAGQGILPAAQWIEEEFRRISAACSGCLEIKRDDFVEPGSADPHSRVRKPTRMVNIFAVLHGTSPDPAAPWALVTGHYDSRATDVMDATTAAPGANDDASGVAVALESARALSRLKLPGTLVFVAVAGEEQGLNGSRHLAQFARHAGWPLVAVLNDDIVGGDTTPALSPAGPQPSPDAPLQDKNVVRVFSESVSASATPEQQREVLALGEENDSPSRELARAIAELAPAYFPNGMQRMPAVAGEMRSHAVRLVPGFRPVLIQRRDRYLRGGDHTSFNAEGFAAVRFTEWRENFDHQHQTLRTEGGAEFGDLLKFVDAGYVANVARLNAATLATLAQAPSPPRNVRLRTASLDNNSDLEWQPAAFAPAGTTYEVVWRATNELTWRHVQTAGAQTHLKIGVSKDNVLFGVRAVAVNGARSLAVPPLPAR